MHLRQHRTLAVVATAALVTPTYVAAADDTRPGPDSPVATASHRGAGPTISGIGDAYFPQDGNGGYNARHYTLNLRYFPKTGRLAGTTVVRLQPKRRMKAFHLDFLMRPESVVVDGERARWRKTSRHELRVRPERPLRRGHTYRIRVSYAGHPARLKHGGERNWHKTPTGAFALGQPHVATWWFPSNDHPRDKATYAMNLTVPRGQQAISNGRLVKVRRGRLTSTWRWRSAKPMASYLAYAAFGRYDIDQGTTRGYPWINAYEKTLKPRVRKAAQRSLESTPRALDFLSDLYGTYPYGTSGGVVPDAPIGYALESQTRPVYGKDFFSGGFDTLVVVHELAHQWFGDRVTVGRWRDVWLNESFATWSEWKRIESWGSRSAQQQLMITYSVFGPSNGFWRLPIGNPGPSQLFNGSVYTRGAMTIQALKNRIGDHDFARLVHAWGHGPQVATTPRFQRMAENISGEDLDGFFRAWLTAGKPARTAENGLRPHGH